MDWRRYLIETFTAWMVSIVAVVLGVVWYKATRPATYDRATSQTIMIIAIAVGTLVLIGCVFFGMAK